MSDFGGETLMNRRGFLKGSALIAAAIATASSAFAQDPQTKPAPGGDGEKTGGSEPSGGGKPEEPPRKKLVDPQGREYRVCDMCGGNMYKQESTWTCEQCGFSYVE